MDQTQTKIDNLIEKFDSFYKMQIEVNASTHTDLQTIMRGLYGDERNNVPGVLKRLTKAELFINRINQKIFKLSVIVTLVLGGAEVLWNLIKDKL